MKRRLLRALGYGTSVLFLLAGASALSRVVRSFLGTSVAEPVSTIMLGLGLIVLGYAGFRFVQLNYRGGASSILGAIFVLAGVWNIAHFAEAAQLLFTRDSALEAAAGAIMISGGYLLLRAGHERHRRLAS